MDHRFENDWRPTAMESLTVKQLWMGLLAVTVGDIGTTMYGLQIGAVEGNPVVANAIEAYGFSALLALKLLYLGTLWTGLQIVPGRYERPFLLVNTVYFTAVVSINVLVLGQLQGIW